MSIYLDGEPVGTTTPDGSARISGYHFAWSSEVLELRNDDGDYHAYAALGLNCEIEDSEHLKSCDRAADPLVGYFDAWPWPGGTHSIYNLTFTYPIATSQGAAVTVPPAKTTQWAIVIGVSRYSDPRIPRLSYADRDAESFRDWLIASSGGGYAPSRVLLLLNENATYQNLRRALFSWATEPLAEDELVIFFAGHGAVDSPEPDSDAFLLPFDAKHDDIAATALPMWEVERALRKVKAKRVIVVVDACHAAGVGAGFDVTTRASDEDLHPLSATLQELPQRAPGICVLNATAERELSQEHARWGGGHGVFTYFLLQGLNGAADANHDRRVTMSELSGYVSEEVRRETKNHQTPTIAGHFPPDLTIARPNDISAP